MATIKHFRDLRAWQQCRAMRQRIRLLVKTWPEEERFKLADQAIRSSRGPTANIAEGYGRFYEKENIRFCRMARGSLYETQDHLITAFDEGYIDGLVLKEHIELIEEATKTVNAYIHYLGSMTTSKGNSVSEPPASYGVAQSAVPCPPSPDHPLIADL